MYIIIIIIVKIFWATIEATQCMLFLVFLRENMMLLSVVYSEVKYTYQELGIS